MTRKIGNIPIKFKLNQKFNPTNLPTEYCFLFCKCLPTLTGWLEPRTLRGDDRRKPFPAPPPQHGDELGAGSDAKLPQDWPAHFPLSHRKTEHIRKVKEA